VDRALDPGASLELVFNALPPCFSADAVPISGTTMLVLGAKKLDIARIPAASPESLLGGAISGGEVARAGEHARPQPLPEGARE
jgi:hypothetical protein